MVQTDELRGIIAKKGKSQAAIASKLGMSPKTFYSKMKKGVFGTDEAEIMITELDIENPAEIFLAKK